MKENALMRDLKGKQTNQGVVLTLGDVQFAPGKADVAPGSQRSLDELAAYLKKNPDR
jgi:outer membrane protein OmpA-like peptidoglycan-associated protein